MKYTIVGIMVLSLISVNHLVFAETDSSEDDQDWITQCIKDHENEIPSKALQKYCQCMNDKMGDDEMRSICGWEKTHPKEKSDCEKSLNFL